MFWGLIMEPQRRYSQSVKKPFHISMAALDESTSDVSPTQVICTFEDRNYLLCTLQKGKTSQVALDLNFEIGDKISFATNGKAHVHLTGYLTEQYLEDVEEEEDDNEDAVEEEEEVDVKEVEEGFLSKRRRQIGDKSNSPPKKKSKTLELLEAVNSNDEDDEDDSDVNMSDLMEEEDADTTGIEEEEEDEDEDDDDDEAEEEDDSDDDDEGEDEVDTSSMSEEEEEIPKLQKVIENGVDKKKRRQSNATATQEVEEKPQVNERRKREKPGDKTSAKDKSPAKADKTPAKGAKTPAKGDKTPGKGDKSTPKTEKTPGANQKTPKSPKQAEDTPKKMTVEGGVFIEDLKVGNGPAAKAGKFVRVYYEGKFKNNNKMFDSTTKGPGFEFRLGRQEVIKGWDVGVAGMKVGGKRRITCPPNMAYGQKGSPPTIPPNSTLVFDVELKNVK